MSILLRGKLFYLLLSLCLLFVSKNGFGQGCNGRDGTGIFTGSIANRDNGTICANNAVQPGLMEIDISNVDEGGTIQFEINWDDGSPPQRINATRIGTGRFFGTASHLFPPNGAQVKCEYRPTVQLVFNGTTCSATLGTPPRFVRWNTDNQRTGDLNLVETLTNVNEYLVCEGVETNVTFTDRSRLNCVPPNLVLGPNDRRRWRQFTYGTANTITGGVRIGGTPRTFPFNGAVDASTEPTTTSGFPTQTTQIITVPATARDGEIFEITMNYWNTCNPYPARPAVIERARIRVVSQPPAPSGNDETVCNGSTPGDFVVTGVPAGNIVNWYRNVPGSPDAPGTLITSGTSTSLPVTSVPGYAGNTTARVYKVWASYRPDVANALNCESQRIALTRTIREELTVPDPSSGPPASVCNTQSFTITFPGPANETIGGSTEYIFSGTGGVSVGSSTANSVTFNTNYTFAPGELSRNRTVRVTRRYTSDPRCDEFRNFTVRVYNETVGGTLSDFPDVCEGTSVGPITLSGYVGNIVRWEVEKDGGGFGTYSGPASGDEITPGMLTEGTYRFRAVIDNGPCDTEYSSIETVVVTDNPTPPTAGTDQAFCGSLVSAPQDATLPAGTGTWTYISSVPSGRPAPTFTANDENTTFGITNATRSGAYTMRWTVVSGSCTFSDDVVIDFGAIPDDVLAMPAIDVCGETATLAADPPSIGRGTWTIVSGPGGLAIDDVNSPTSDISLNNPYTYGTYVLEWRVTSGMCPAKFNTVSVTFNEAVTALATDISNVCLVSGGTTNIPLTGTVGGGAPNGAAATGTWVNVNGNGTIANIVQTGSTVTATYEANNADYIAGTPIRVKLVATPGSGNCPPVEEEITITVDRVPVADAGADLDVCGDAVQLNAEDPPPYSATGKWTGPAGITFDDDTDPRTTVRNLPPPPGSVTLRWTLTSAGGNACTDYDEVVIDRVVSPSAIDVNPVVCEVAPAGGALTTEILLTDYETAVTSIPVADRTIQWYEDGPPPLGTLIADPTVLLTNVPDGKVYVARVRETLTGCTSDAIVSINIRALPAATPATVALCEDTPGSNTALGIDLIGDLTYRDAITTGGNQIEWFNTLLEAQTDAPGTEITAPFDVVGSRTVFARVTYSNTPACSNFAALTLSVKPLPINAAILGRSQVCVGDPSILDPDELPVETYQVTSVTGAKYYWNIPTGPGQFKVFGGGTEDDFFVLLQFPSIPATNPETISVRVELNGCSTPQIDLPITVTRQPEEPDLIGAQIVCENDENISFAIVPPHNFPVSNYSWEIRRQSNDTEGGAFISTGQGTNQISVKFNDEDVYVSVRENNTICVSDTTQYWVTVNKRPVMLDNDAAVCSDSKTEIIFDKDMSSPVLIDKYNINTVQTTPGINFISPISGPPFPVQNVAADAIKDHIFENREAVPLTVNYNVTPISVGAGGKECAGTSQVITVTVKPEPQLSPGLNKSVCSEEITGITLISANNTFPADRFLITKITIPTGVASVVPGDIPIADSLTLYQDNVLFNNRWVNSTSDNQVVQYRILPYSTLLGCAGNPAATVNVTIYPRTEVKPIADMDLCNGELLNVAFESSNNPDADFLWKVNSYSPEITIMGPGADQGNISNLMLVNNTLVDGTVTFEVRGKNPPTEEGASECVNPIQTFTVTVLRSPRANHILDIPVCSDTPGGTSYTADLAALESTITPDAGNGDTEIKWFTEDPSSPTAVEITGASLNAYVVQNTIPVFVQVTTLSTTCKKVVRVSYKVNPAVSFNTTVTDLLCYGYNSGEIKVDALNGTAPFSYTRDGGASITPIAPNNTYTFTGLSGNNNVDYVITVQDQHGCSATANVSVFEPTELVATLVIDNPITCFLGSDGAVETSVTGGTGPYASYRLLQTGVTDPNDGLFENLSLGTYNVRVTDANGCTDDSNQITLTQPTAVEITAVNVTPISCNDAQDGVIEVIAGGGNGGNYDYTLTNSNDPANPITATGGPTQLFSSSNGNTIGHGNYTIVVEDVQGCRSQPAIAVLLNPQKLNAGLIGLNQSICAGEVPVEIDQLVPPFGGNGLGTYQFRWEQSNDGIQWIDAGAATPTFTPPLLTETRYYRRIVTSGICPEQGADNKVEITVNPLPLVNFTSQASEVCTDQAVLLNIELTPGTGTNPLTYTYTDGVDTYSNEVGQGPVIRITPKAIQQNTTYTLLALSDVHGCQATGLPKSTSVDLIKVNSDFTVLDPSEQCSGGEFTFRWKVEDNVAYRWEFGDGHEETFAAGSLPLGDHTVKHIFPNSSPVSSTLYQVKLYADFFSCKSNASKPVTVYPTVALNIAPRDTSLCSGQTLVIEDLSQGVDIGTWYYRELGSNQRLEEVAGPIGQVNYAMTNNTFTNPIIYEVVYEARNNEGCTDIYRQEVQVFRGIQADFSTSDVPPFTGGLSVVTYTNTSTPVDAADFEYTWDFDDIKASPSKEEGAGPFVVEYYSAGERDVMLRAVNIEARNQGEVCESSIIKTINVMLPELGAAFKATPLASCFPANITVQNLSPGADTFLWEIYNETGLVDSSKLRNPVFRILKPGIYDIYLTAGFAATNQIATAELKGIEVFDVPSAIFESRPNPVYIPDTELRTFNFSTRANQYFWDFDDGFTSDQFEPRHTYTLEGKYNIMLVAGFDNGQKDIDGDGVLDGNVICYDTASVEIIAQDGGFLKIPNAFTPNIGGSTDGTGVPGSGTFNDIFLPITSGVEEFTMQIFDRWGTLVFETRDKKVGWDGYDRNKRLMPAGVYVYKLVMRLSDGQRTTKIGDVTLLR